MKTEIVCIVATDCAGGIGKDNVIPWKIPAEMAHFRKSTVGKPVIMGRKTWESLPAPLKDRFNIVVTSAESLEGAAVAKTPQEALKIAEEWWEGVEHSELPREVYVIGGAQIYKAFEPYYDKVIVTRVEHSFPCDTTFDDKFITGNVEAWSMSFVTRSLCIESGMTFSIFEFNKNKSTTN